MKNIENLFNYSLLIISIILFLSPNIVKAEVIYDNLTTTNYKIIKIHDNSNIKYINEYDYEIYINNSYLGKYKYDELIYIPDNSSILIYIPESINMDVDKSWDIGKTYLTIAIMYFVGFGIFIILIIWFIKKIIKR